MYMLNFSLEKRFVSGVAVLCCALLSHCLSCPASLCCVIYTCRSYGVLLWEMVSYGALPLYGLSSHEIAEHAQSGKLQHVMYVSCTHNVAI